MSSGDDSSSHVVSSTVASWLFYDPWQVQLGCVQVREEAQAVASRCSKFIRVSSLAVDSAAVQRDIFLHIGQVVVSTPGQVAQVLPPTSPR